jgi:hypothetical protein
MGSKIPEELEKKVLQILEIMGLALNKDKTKIVKAREKPFDFLGFTFRYDKCLFNKGNKYWNVIPSKKAQNKIRKKIRDYLKVSGHLLPIAIAKDLNDKLRGWINYYDIPRVSYPSQAKGNIEWYLKGRLKRYYKRKSQRKCKLYRKGAFEILVEKYGLIKPTLY